MRTQSRQSGSHLTDGHGVGVAYGDGEAEGGGARVVRVRRARSLVVQEGDRGGPGGGGGCGRGGGGGGVRVSARDGCGGEQGLQGAAQVWRKGCPTLVKVEGVGGAGPQGVGVGGGVRGAVTGGGSGSTGPIPAMLHASAEGAGPPMCGATGLCVRPVGSWAGVGGCLRCGDRWGGLRVGRTRVGGRVPRCPAPVPRSASALPGAAAGAVRAGSGGVKRRDRCGAL